MNKSTRKTIPFADQRPGTAGLRRRVSEFRQPGFLENFIQAIFDSVPTLRGGRIVLGGDGRYWNRDAMQTILRMAAAHGVATASVARGGLLSTPAASIAIPALSADGGFLLTASHNPAGPEGDFGIKYCTGNGGQASEGLTDAIAARAASIAEYSILEGVPTVDLDRPGTVYLDRMRIDIFEPVGIWADAMERLFDFDRIRAAIADGLTLRFDAMNAVTGPYAAEVFVRRLGCPEVSLMRATPREDFGGIHPDPTPHSLPELMALSAADGSPDLIAASDGDGDRNFIAGPGLFVSPGDSLAVMAAHARAIPGYREGLHGVARSMPTSQAVDRVAAELGIPCHETPTGWRYFCNLLDAGLVTLCGEESFGTSSDHCREKDGLWAALFWLNLLATTGKSIPDLLREHWDHYGRTFFLRHDYLIAQSDVAHAIYQGLRDSMAELQGRVIAGRRVIGADEFSYSDPVDGTTSAHQGLRVVLEGNARIVYRLSGTDAVGRTLRVYLEDYTVDTTRFGEPAAVALGSLAEAARDLARVTQMTGATKPTLAV